MTEPYHKIQSAFRRDGRGAFLPEWSRPEFAALQGLPWEWTEKVDGTNLRVSVGPDSTEVGIAGRTDRAQIPASLLAAIAALELPERARALRGPVTLYGEGYGRRIQGGGKYRKGVGFVLFDVRVDSFWLQRDAVADVGQLLGVDVVPVVGRGTLLEALHHTRQGFTSAWGDFAAEGLVCRPPVQLFNRQGHRIVCKTKTRDRFTFELDPSQSPGQPL